MNSEFSFRFITKMHVADQQGDVRLGKQKMQETLSTFPLFQDCLRECGGDLEKAFSQYVVKVNDWHGRLTLDIINLVENAKTELRDMTPRMVLETVLGPREKLVVLKPPTEPAKPR